MIIKNKIFKSIGFKILAFYILLSLISLSFIISIIFENQVDLIGKNTMLESEKQISELIGAMKKFTSEMKQGTLFKTDSEGDSLKQLIRIISLHSDDFIIISENGSVIHKSSGSSELPGSFTEDILRAITSSTFSGKNYYLRIDEAKQIMNFYIPLNDFYPGNSNLLIKKDIVEISRSLSDLYKQVTYVILVVVFFHILFAGLLYWSFIMPLKTLAETAKKFSEGDLTARVSITGKSLELDSIASAFNDMAESASRNINSLSYEMESVKNINRKRDITATRDELTGLFNSSYFNERLDEEIRQLELSGKFFSLIIADIDDFSRFNALYGKQAGDIILLETAKKIASCCSGTDIPARIGGEEFAVLSPVRDREGILELAETIRSSVADNSVVTPDGTFSITISIGLSSVTVDVLKSIRGRDDILNKALSALEEAKREGKNRAALS